ncbi:MAG: TSUP family transporter, partial [Planctomycetota bacterium]
MEPVSYLLGGTSALLVGFAKTAVPGAAILAVMLMAMAFPLQDAKLSVGALLPVLLLGDVFAVAWYRRHARWDRLLRLLPYVAVGMVPGAIVLQLSDGGQLRPVLGLLVLVLLVLEVCRRQFGWERLSGRWWFVALMGVLAGFFTTVGNAAGPVMSIYLISQGVLKEEFIGTAAWFFLIVNLSKLPIYAGPAGVITPATLHFDLFVAPLAALGALSGVYVLGRIPQRLF